MMKDLCDVSEVGSRVAITSTVSTSLAPSRPQPRRRQSPASDQRDLCSACTYVSECMHRGTADSPRLFCELFDVDVPALSRREHDHSSQEHGSSPIAGLCCNCEARQICTIRASKGDVWHCEEYC
jgi:hypothetical protein